MTEDKYCMWSMFLYSCLNNSLSTRRGSSTIKTHSYNIANLKMSLIHLTSAKYMLSACAISTQRQNGVCCVALSAVVCLQTLQKAPLMSSSYTTQLNLFSQFFVSIFSSLSKAELTLYKPSWRGAQQYRNRNQNSWILFPYGY